MITFLLGTVAVVGFFVLAFVGIWWGATGVGRELGAMRAHRDAEIRRMVRREIERDR